VCGLANDHAPIKISGGADALPLFCFALRGHDLKRETGFPSRRTHGVGVEITI
jgi:hypothetical protein